MGFWNGNVRNKLAERSKLKGLQTQSSKPAHRCTMGKAEMFKKDSVYDNEASRGIDEGSKSS